MKCIKAIKETKDVSVGTIKRVDDKTAINMVGSFWEYISKAEWKAATKKPKTEKTEVESPESVEKKPYKKGQKSEKHKNKQ